VKYEVSNQVGNARARRLGPSMRAWPLDVEFRPGDAEDLPAGDASFDAVLSVFGVMFAPDHQRAAGEIVRVTVVGQERTNTGKVEHAPLARDQPRLNGLATRRRARSPADPASLTEIRA
jgi:SAM-dependent methyltransferase